LRIVTGTRAGGARRGHAGLSVAGPAALCRLIVLRI